MPRIRFRSSPPGRASRSASVRRPGRGGSGARRWNAEVSAADAGAAGVAGEALFWLADVPPTAGTEPSDTAAVAGAPDGLRSGIWGTAVPEGAELDTSFGGCGAPEAPDGAEDPVTGTDAGAAGDGLGLPGCGPAVGAAAAAAGPAAWAGAGVVVAADTGAAVGLPVTPAGPLAIGVPAGDCGGPEAPDIAVPVTGTDAGAVGEGAGFAGWGPAVDTGAAAAPAADPAPRAGAGVAAVAGSGTAVGLAVVPAGPLAAGAAGG